MVSKHLRDVRAYLVKRQAMGIGVAAEDLGWLIHERRRRHGHLEAAGYVIHRARSPDGNVDQRCVGDNDRASAIDEVVRLEYLLSSAKTLGLEGWNRSSQSETSRRCGCMLLLLPSSV